MTFQFFNFSSSGYTQIFYLQLTDSLPECISNQKYFFSRELWSRLMSEFRTGIQERGISVFPKRGGLSIRHIIGIAVAFSITITSGILLWNTGSFSHVLAVYDSHALPQDSPNNLIHNDKKSGMLDTIRIRTFDIDWYTLATVDGPMKVRSFFPPLPGSQICR